MSESQEVAQGVEITPPPPVAVMEVSPKVVELPPRDAAIDKFFRHGSCE